MNKNPAALEALVRRNALACEHALKPRCKCLCGRTLHRQHHSEAWIKATVAAHLAGRPQAAGMMLNSEVTP
jgi:hypothetical protein